MVSSRMRAAIERFSDDLSALLGHAPEPARPLGIAVSGGPDSMALLVLAAAAFPGAVRAATVDHGLRDGSAAEAAMVAAACDPLGVPHITLSPDAPIAGASIQARARDARYAALARWAAGERLIALATAHHADDQAETLLMRAARGSGISGLAAIRSRVTIAGLTVVRPLLGWRRAELRAIVQQRGLRFVDDPANADPRHDRTRFRALLADNAWLDPPALARTAAAIAEADADLAALAESFWAERARDTPTGVRFDPAGLPRDTLRRLVRRAVGVVRDACGIGTPPFERSANIEPLLGALSAGRRATHGGVIGLVRDGEWHFAPAPPRRSH